jgi:IclR family acetate operon transcriptional repressor
VTRKSVAANQEILTDPSGAPEAQQSTMSLRSVENALHLLELLLLGRPLGVTEAARHLEVARSTAHRLLVVLKNADFAVQGADHRYRLGPALTRDGSTQSLRSVMRPYVEHLSQRLNETVHMMVLEGTTVRFIDGVEGAQALRVGSRTGLTLPAHRTSGGKALLAAIPPRQVRLLYRGSEAEVDLSQLEEELVHVRRIGYAVNNGQTEAGVTAVGAVVANQNGRPVAAVAIAVPSVRVGIGGVRRLGGIVHAAAQEMSTVL